MYLRHSKRTKNGKTHTYWRLVKSVRLGGKVRQSIPAGWHDSVAVRIGYEYFPTTDDVFRAGYVYHENPIPDSTLFPLLAGTLEHAVTLGYGHKWNDWRIDFAYQYSWGSTNHSSFNKIVGGDFDNSSVKSQAHWFFVGVSWSF